MPNAKRIIKGKLEKYELRVDRLPGLLGDDYGVVRVPGQDGYVYYRTPTGDVHTAWNDRVQNTPNLPIFYGMLNRRMQILETRDVYITPNRAQNMPEHGFNHAWPAGDTVPVWPEQFKAWGLDPVSGLTVRLYQGTIYLPNNTLVHVDTTDIPLTPPASGAIYALIYISTVGAISVAYGTPAVDSMELLTLACIPATTGIPLWAVRLYDGQVNITRGTTSTDLIDLRFSFFGGAGYTTKVTIVTNTYTVLGSDTVVVCNKATAFTVNLPAATGTGHMVYIKNIGVGNVTVDANSSELIDGQLTQLVYQWDCMTIVDAASGAWYII